ncbi:MAG TPA: hypothetical protein VD928_03780 [Candidatus Paceibacterota bacterium]|nr:hypothetical protein [Candidatus Paceibacterota bacterium]
MQLVYQPVPERKAKDNLSIQFFKAALETETAWNIPLITVRKALELEKSQSFGFVVVLEDGDVEMGLALARWAREEYPFVVYARHEEKVSPIMWQMLPSGAIVIDSDMLAAAQKLWELLKQRISDLNFDNARRKSLELQNLPGKKKSYA